MSIAAIGGATPTQSPLAAGNVRNPEAGEVAGTADHDGDPDAAGAKAAAATASGAKGAGRVDLKA